MEFRENYSIESALHLLLEQILASFESKKLVATLLSCDISGAFDSISPSRLLYSLIQKGLPLWLISFIHSFTHSHSTTLLLPRDESELFKLEDGVPQGSPLSIILFILYNSSLFDLVHSQGLGITSIKYANNLNLLAISSSASINCIQLRTLYDSFILPWARKFGIQFTPQKYELVHFSRSRRANLNSITLATLDLN